MGCCLLNSEQNSSAVEHPGPNTHAPALPGPPSTAMSLYRRLMAQAEVLQMRLRERPRADDSGGPNKHDAVYGTAERVAALAAEVIALMRGGDVKPRGVGIYEGAGDATNRAEWSLRESDKDGGGLTIGHGTGISQEDSLFASSLFDSASVASSRGTDPLRGGVGGGSSILSGGGSSSSSSGSAKKARGRKRSPRKVGPGRSVGKSSPFHTKAVQRAGLSKNKGLDMVSVSDLQFQINKLTASRKVDRAKWELRVDILRGKLKAALQRNDKYVCVMSEQGVTLKEQSEIIRSLKHRLKRTWNTEPHIEMSPRTRKLLERYSVERKLLRVKALKSSGLGNQEDVDIDAAADNTTGGAVEGDSTPALIGRSGDSGTSQGGRSGVSKVLASTSPLTKMRVWETIEDPTCAASLAAAVMQPLNQGGLGRSLFAVADNNTQRQMRELTALEHSPGNNVNAAPSASEGKDSVETSNPSRRDQAQLLGVILYDSQQKVMWVSERRAERVGSGDVTASDSTSDFAPPLCIANVSVGPIKDLSSLHNLLSDIVTEAGCTYANNGSATARWYPLNTPQPELKATARTSKWDPLRSATLFQAYETASSRNGTVGFLLLDAPSKVVAAHAAASLSVQCAGPVATTLLRHRVARVMDGATNRLPNLVNESGGSSTSEKRATDDAANAADNGGAINLGPVWGLLEVSFQALRCRLDCSLAFLPLAPCFVP